ncbi:hypothetical protein V6N11_022755 [Hibiscus sabdariffa]|uniref:Uncharacterized protein n=1 Tax=Hibiscus sabdariffa TaxID=183260 RepID=A0ABR2TK53_9ROSI
MYSPGNSGFTYNVRGSFPMCPSKLGNALTASVTNVLLAIAAVRPPSALVSNSIGWGGDDHRMFTVKSAYSLRPEVPLAVQDLVLANGNFEAPIQTQFPTQRAYDDPGGR